MSEFIYKEYLPLNARIIIDYNQKKGEKVKFSYPVEMEYSKAVWKRAYPTIFGLWAIIHIQFLIYVGLPIMIIQQVLDLFDKSVTISTVILIDNLLLFIFLFEFFILPAILTYYLSRNKERLSSFVPKAGYWSGRLLVFLKEINFTANEITEENKAIIPIFSNVTLNWFPTQDFASYLEKIEILELPYSYKLRLFWWTKKWTHIKNETSFRAVFFFNRKPEKGCMRVEFI